MVLGKGRKILYPGIRVGTYDKNTGELVTNLMSVVTGSR
jgi:hypothetical protein